MTRPLVLVLCVVLMASPASYSIAMNYMDGGAAAVSDSVLDKSDQGKVLRTLLTLSCKTTSKVCETIAAIESKIVAGIEAGKSFLRAAAIVTTTMVRVARHAATAVAETAVSLF